MATEGITKLHPFSAFLIRSIGDVCKGGSKIGVADVFLDGVVSQAITVEIQGQKDQKTALCIVQNGDSWETGPFSGPK
jgi:hypothetical protein